MQWFLGMWDLPVHVMHAVAEKGEGQDEIQQFLDAQYVGSLEACWRIFVFDMHRLRENVLFLCASPSIFQGSRSAWQL